MVIDVRAIGFELTQPLRQHVEERLKRVLAPFARLVTMVTVRLEDVNADRGGIDKRCSVVVSMRQRNAVVVEVTDADLYAAVHAVADRTRRLVKRASQKRIALQRRTAQIAATN
jgi:ribosomal subunit interface protein